MVVYMMDQFMLLPLALQNQQTTLAIRTCNEFSAKFGLQLSETAIRQIVENHRQALENSGRIEFGGGVIQKIIIEFMDSPYINQDSYADTLMELQECFYYFKNESLEELTDDELIRLMKDYYDNICQGSVEFLQSTMLENYCRDIRYSKQEYRNMNGYEDDYVEFMDWDEKE